MPIYKDKYSFTTTCKYDDELWDCRPGRLLILFTIVAMVFNMRYTVCGVAKVLDLDWGRSCDVNYV